MDWDLLRKEARTIERTMESKLPELAVLNTSLSVHQRRQGNNDPGTVVYRRIQHTELRLWQRIHRKKHATKKN